MNESDFFNYNLFSTATDCTKVFNNSKITQNIKSNVRKKVHKTNKNSVDYRDGLFKIRHKQCYVGRVYKLFIKH